MIGRTMKRFTRKWLAPLTASLLLALAASAEVFARSADEAAREAARQHDAKVLSVKTVQQGKQRVYVIRLLTRDGVVKTVRVPADDR